MSNLREIQFGYVNAELLELTVAKINGILKSYIRASDDPEFKTDPYSIKEVIELSKKVVGKDFGVFLKANYNHGKGVRSKLVRGIVFFLDGRISGRSLGTFITADERYVTENRKKLDNYQPTSSDHNRAYDEVIELIGKVTDDDFYRVLVGVGPVLFARMIMTFGGDSAYEWSKANWNGVSGIKYC